MRVKHTDTDTKTHRHRHTCNNGFGTIKEGNKNRSRAVPKRVCGE